MAQSQLEILVGLRDQASGPLSGLRRALAGMGQIAGGILGAQAIGGLIRGIQSMGREALNAVADYERLAASMQALVARELRSTDATLDMAGALAQAGPKAQELVKWTEQLAIKSPFDQEGVALALKTALAYGFTVEQARALTEATIDFTAATGGTSSQMNSIALALGQMQAKGRVSGQELLQLTNAGMGVNKILEGMGFNLKDVEKGLVSADDFISAVVKTMNDDFGGAAERQSETWAGLLNTMGDLKKIGLREFFGGVFKAVQPLVAKLAEWLQGPGLLQIKAWGERLGLLATEFVRLFQALFNIGPASDAVRYSLSRLFGPEMGSFISDVIRKISDFISFFQAGGGLSQIAAPFQPIIDAIGGLLSAFQDSGPKIREEIGNIGTTLGNILGTQGPQIIENFAGIINSIATLWKQHGDNIIQFVSEAIQIIGVVLIGGVQLISGLISAALKLLTGDWQGAWNAMRTSIEIFADGIMRLMGTTLEQVRRTWENNLNMLVTIVRLLWSKMVEAGGRIVQGLKTGISNQWNALVSWLKGKIAALVATIKAALQIQSPSGVFADIGAQMMAGLAQGIQGAVKMPQLALAGANRGVMGATGNTRAGPGLYIREQNITIMNGSDIDEIEDAVQRGNQQSMRTAASLGFAG